MADNTWRRGRSGICNGQKGERITFQICPKTKKELNEFSSKTGILKSLVINQAILSYIKNNKGE